MKNILLTTFTVLALGTAVSGYRSPASADVVYITATGTVSGTDAGGLFGVAGTDLTGDAYTAKYTFDTSLGYTYSSANENYAYGGSAYGNASPALGASLTINGQSFSIAGTNLGEIIGRNDGGFTESLAYARDDGSYLVNYMYGYPGTSPASITTAFSLNAIDNSYRGGGFEDYNTSTYLNLTPSVYAESVPEPASMALLGVGLATIGLIRRKRA